MSTHNICFHGEIRKIFTGYPPLSRPMVLVKTFLKKIIQEAVKLFDPQHHVPRST